LLCREGSAIKTDDMGDRMKGYEATTRNVLPRRTYTILRVDGRAFHSLLRKADKPFDADFLLAMEDTAIELCHDISGSVFAYQQSDEISVLLADFGSVHSEPWFGGGIQKMASVSASMATKTFNRVRRLRANSEGTFDSRVFTIPTSVEVANYFVWRQRDWMRNSVNMVGRANFSQKQLHGLNTSQVQELLWQEKGINWADYPDHLKRGSIVVKGNTVPRLTNWIAMAAPDFKAQTATWLAHVIPPLPAFE
jgi:tRNA(His) guanylyltransferase